jgi:hypothetical protein
MYNLSAFDKSMADTKKQTSWEIKMKRVLATLVTTKQLTTQQTHVTVSVIVLAIATVIATPTNVVN